LPDFSIHTFPDFRASAAASEVTLGRDSYIIAITPIGTLIFSTAFGSVVRIALTFLLAPVMAKIPLSALAGVLMVTAWRMNEWGEIKTIFSKKFISGIAKFLVTMIATIVFDLTIAIVIGIVLSAFIFIYRSSKSNISVADIDEEKYGSKISDVTKAIYIKGPVFFANTAKLEKVFSEELSGVEELIISLDGVNAIDTSGTSALCEQIEHLRKNSVKVILCGCSESVMSMLNKLSIKGIVGEENIVASMDQAIERTIDKAEE